MIKIIKPFVVATVLAIGVSVLFVCSRPDTNEDKQYKQQVFNEYAIFAVPMPDSLYFAGEIVPLKDSDVYERVDRELHVNTYWQSNGLLMFKRANKYFPIIEPILKKNNIPDDFKYLCVIESGMQNVVSPSGAAGFWQFMKATAKENNLEVSAEVDERYHLEKSTQAACTYLLEAKQKFGSWSLAAASYNMGMTGLEKQLARQKVNNYYDLLLNSETSRYVMRMVAVKEIMENPDKYGFNFREKDLYQLQKTKTVVIDSAIADMADFANTFNMNYKSLKNNNPWLRQAYLHNKAGKKYEIKVLVEEE